MITFFNLLIFAPCPIIIVFFVGAFLIPYVIMLAIEGIPIFYMELALGQRLRKGAIGAWNEVSPYLGGIGIASAMVSFWVSLYYNTIIAWCLFYLVRSFSASLPWAECPSVTVGNETMPVQECDVSFRLLNTLLNVSPKVLVSCYNYTILNAFGKMQTRFLNKIQPSPLLPQYYTKGTSGHM